MEHPSTGAVVVAVAVPRLFHFPADSCASAFSCLKIHFEKHDKIFPEVTSGAAAKMGAICCESGSGLKFLIISLALNPWLTTVASPFTKRIHQAGTLVCFSSLLHKSAIDFAATNPLVHACWNYIRRWFHPHPEPRQQKQVGNHTHHCVCINFGGATSCCNKFLFEVVLPFTAHS